MHCSPTQHTRMTHTHMQHLCMRTSACITLHTVCVHPVCVCWSTLAHAATRSHRHAHHSALQRKSKAASIEEAKAVLNIKKKDLVNRLEGLRKLNATQGVCYMKEEGGRGGGRMRHFKRP